MRNPEIFRRFGFSHNAEREAGGLEVSELRPEHEKTAVPTLVAGGWGETPKTLEGTMRIIAESGRRVLSLAHPRKLGAAAEELAAEQHFPAEEIQKALTLLEALDARGIDRADVIAHSEGAINVMIAASLYPEKFRNIVLVAPGGMIGKDNFFALAKRFMGKMADTVGSVARGEETKKTDLRALREGIKYAAENPVLAAKEARAISESDIHEMLRDHRKRGGKVGIIAGVDDRVFPMERVQQHTQAEEVDGFLSVKGDHDALYRHPEQHTGAAEKLLTMLEEKQEKMQDTEAGKRESEESE